jgi:CDP-6-deoxy-D-xylo-4-hexulose-3-dehydrase
MNASDLKQEILRLTREYCRLAHTANRPGDDARRPAFVASEGAVPYAGRVFMEDEVEAAVAATFAPPHPA